MADLPIEELLPRANYSMYTLVRTAAIRSLELSDGSRCLAENSTTEKFTTMALEELSQGKIELKAAAEGRDIKAEVQEESQEEE